MATQDPLEFLQQFQGASVAAPGAPGRIPPEQFLSDYTPETSPAPAQPATSLGAGVLRTLGFIGRKFAAGVLGSGQNMAVGEGFTPSDQTVDPTTAVFGTSTPNPPNALARYGGAIAEATGANPLLAGVMPLATAGGALGGEAANQLFPGSKAAEIAGGAIGGLGAGGVGALARSLMGARSLATIAKSLGQSETQQQAGAALQGHASTWLSTTLPAAEAEVWKPVDAAMHTADLPQGPNTPITSYVKTLDDITTGGGVLSGQLQKMRPTLPDQLKGQLDKSLVGMGISPSWDDVRELRSAIGQGMVDSKSPLQSIGQKNLDRLYAAVTQDLNKTADQAGAGDLFSTANSESSRLRGLAEDNIGPLVAPGVTPEKAMDVAMGQAKKGGTNLATLRAVLPDEATNELAAAHLLQTPKGWAKLAPEAKAALVPDPTTRSRIDSAVQALANHPAPGSDKLTVQAILGEGLGQAIAPMLHLDPGLMAISGAVVPPVLAGARTVARNPSALRFPAAGALAGNDLSP
jgi:hypothetical protein